MVNQVPVNTIEITEKAANKVKIFAENDGKSNYALRVAVKGGGCSGLTYDLEILTQARYHKYGGIYKRKF